MRRADIRGGPHSMTRWTIPDGWTDTERAPSVVEWLLYVLAIVLCYGAVFVC